MPPETQANQELVGTFFDEVINAHRADRAPELLSETVVDHNKIVLTEPEDPALRRKGCACCSPRFRTSTPMCAK